MMGAVWHGIAVVKGSLRNKRVRGGASGTCLHCGQIFRVKRPCDGERYCSRRCAAKSKAIGPWHHRQELFCTVCLQAFRTTRKHLKAGACSVACGRTLHALKLKAKPKKPRPVKLPKQPKQYACHQCGIVFESVRVRKYCSDRCTWRSNASEKKTRRRIREEVNKVWHRIDRSAVLKRDKYICALCHQRIPRNVKYPNGKTGTVDHIIPLSKGGEHLWSNVQAAHASCNSRKHTQSFGQLRIC